MRAVQTSSHHPPPVPRRWHARPAAPAWPWLLAAALLLALAAPAPAAAVHHRPKLGLALSGGGAKGMAHIGILQVLEDMGVRVDYIAGTSMGAIIGGLYAAGYSPAQMLKIVQHVDWADAFSSNPRRRLLRYDQKGKQARYLFEVGLAGGKLELPTGILADYKLMALLNRYCLPVDDIASFDKLPIPFRAVATDLTTGQRVVLGRGSLAQAMRASMSIPSIFPPFELDGRLLVDGGLVENLPVQTVRDMGADVVIAVNVGSPLRKKDQLGNFLAVLDQITTFQIVASTRRQAKLADLVITPVLGKIGTASFDEPKKIYLVGLKAGRRARAKIAALLKRKGVPLGAAPRRPLHEPKTIRVGRVTFKAPKALTLDLGSIVGIKTGQVVAADELDAAVQKIYGLGLCKSVYYRVRTRPDGVSDIHFILKTEAKNELSARVGFTLNTSTNRSPDYTFRFNVTYPALFDRLGMAEMDLVLGKDYGVRFRWRIPSKRYFIIPELFYTSNVYEIYQGSHIISEYIVDTVAGGVDAGWYFGSTGMVSLGYQAKWVKVRPRIGSQDLRRESDFLAGLRLRLGVDRLDQYPYSRRGLRSRLELEWMHRSLGSEVNYLKATWDARLAISLDKRNTFIPNLTLSSAFNTDSPASQCEVFGGFPGFWGYSWEEFIGHEIMRFQLLYNFRFTENLILMTAVNVGGAWRDLSDLRDHLTRLYWGGGVGLGWSTPLGPLNLVFGVGDGGRYQLYLTFGVLY